MKLYECRLAEYSEITLRPETSVEEWRAALAHEWPGSSMRPVPMLPSTHSSFLPDWSDGQLFERTGPDGSIQGIVLWERPDAPAEPETQEETEG